MFRTIAACAVLALSSAMAHADSKPSDAEAAKVKETLTSIGCTGGEYEKETGKSGGGQRTAVFEIDDATCNGAAYDLKLDKDYKVIIMSRFLWFLGRPALGPAAQSYRA